MGASDIGRGTCLLNWECKFQKLRTFSDENPYDATPTPFHEAKVTVWFNITSTFLIGPYFFEQFTSTGMKTCSITGVRYTTMLQNYAIPELQQLNVFNDIVWIQDGVPPHIATRV